MNLEIKIELDTTVNKHKVFINQKAQCYINPEALTVLFRDAANGLWRGNTQSAIDLGSQLYDILNGLEKRVESGLKEAISKNEPLTVYLEAPVEFYALPFELIYKGEFLLLGTDIRLIWLVNRRGQARGRRDTQMKLLFMASAPNDLPEHLSFDYEREEEEITRAIERYPVELTVESMGSLPGLRDTLIEGMGYDVIHITGPAAIRRDEGPVFYMEDDTGRMQDVTPDMLWDAIYSYPPFLCFLSGCFTAGVKSSNVRNPFAWQLVDKGVPFVLGWAGDITDNEATKAAVEFYRTLAIGKDIYDAVYAARRSIRDLSTVLWAGLRLLSDGTPPAPLVKPGQVHRGIPLRRARYMYLKNSDIRVLETGFVGRRRELQRAIRVLRGETGRYGVLFHGPAGIGKSCLAGKVIERFGDREIVAFKGVITIGGVISGLKGLFERIGSEAALDILKADIAYGDKVKGLFRSAFKDIGVIILFDDFEANIERDGNRFVLSAGSLEVLRPFLEAIDWVFCRTNIIITSRYPFDLSENALDLFAAKIDSISLRSMDGGDLAKKTALLDAVSKSAHKDMYVSYSGGNPHLLEWFNVIASEEHSYDINVLEKILSGKRAEFAHEYLATVIADTKGDDFLRFAQKVAVYREAVPGAAFGVFGGEGLLETGVELTLIERNVVSGGEYVYLVTSVIREAMWDKLTADEKSEANRLAFEWYDSWIEVSEEPDHRYLEEAIYHALEVDNIRGACKHAVAMGNYYNNMVLYREGLAILEKVVSKVSDSVIAEAKENKDEYVVYLLDTYASTLDRLGNLKRAIAFYEKALDISLVVYGEKHQVVAMSYNNLGYAWNNLGDSNKAIEFHEKALAISLDLYGEKHPGVATSYNNLGYAWNNLGDSNKAIEFHEKALAIRLDVHGEKHPEVATSYNNLGYTWYSLGDLKQAIEFHKKALAIWLEVYGEKHPEVARSYANFGKVWYSLGDSKQAIEFHKKALAIRLDVYGEKHPEVAWSYNNIGNAWNNLGDSNKAIEFHEKALAIRLDVHGEKHPEVATSYSNIASVFTKIGDTQKANQYTAKAIEAKNL
ncbi:tetratricopeptide repeat protein [Candidatus Magnetobacterium casense]|uniref:Tetratricopeptide repeat protein n=1 Tax=Candidatus Magnetobacterium casense TaxID=1455061 RepID=A0ABS6RW62_9BACT|nr:tetratricopeptide repeat protein [Candidatus Magnetobacterium casensis]MBV6340687.1 tetratricopeptide repeat protein [Candidatus Magnetobacterium casensis]